MVIFHSYVSLPEGILKAPPETMVDVAWDSMGFSETQAF